jgi:hypothetical protein
MPSTNALHNLLCAFSRGSESAVESVIEGVIEGVTLPSQ